MKALTIWQPWATLIIAGAKPYEFRSWPAYPSLIGQRIVIHAASRKPEFHECRRLLRALESGGDEAAATCLITDIAIPILEGCAAELPRSCGLGTVVLGDPRNGIEIAREFGVSWANDSDRYQHSNWGWPMLDIDAWHVPISARGAQGFWTWPTPGSVLL